MKNTKKDHDPSAPQVTNAQLELLRSRLTTTKGQPLLARGTTSVCPDCGGRMVTTNDLEETIAAPGLVFVVPRLPGARCLECGATQLDGAGVAILETLLPKEILADYETAVTHSSGKTLGTYFKMDLARVLRLTGNERLFWKVVDRDRALVRVERSATDSSNRTKPNLESSQASQEESPSKARSRRRAIVA
ncbi:MAG: hypothetical protein L3K03_03105 [Thermoplasmata archaeon]|nr:hypothetical protein [Thermoplasmata archaeon]